MRVPIQAGVLAAAVVIGIAVSTLSVARPAIPSVDTRAERAGQARAAAPADARAIPAIPYRDENTVPVSDTVLRVVGALLVVAIVGGVAIVVVKRFAPAFATFRSTGAQRLKVVEAQRLAPKLALFLVEVDGRALVVAHSGDQVTCTWAASSAATSDTSAGPWA